MQALVSLLSSLQGVFGQAFLLLGLAPASALVIGWHGYAETPVLAKLLAKDASSVPLIVVLTELFAAALIFYPLSAAIMRLFEELPMPASVPVMNAFRARLVERQRRASASLDERIEIELWVYTCVSWHQRGFAHETGPVPVTGAVPAAVGSAVATCIAQSRRARAIVAQYANAPGTAPREGIGNADRERIIAGLRALAESDRTAGDEPRVAAERAEWLALTATNDGNERNGEAARILEAIEHDIYRRFAALQTERSVFPADERYLKPTRLGNRIAALDDYAEERYGMLTTTLLSRLHLELEEIDRATAVHAQLLVHMYLNTVVALGLLLTLVGADVAMQTVEVLHRVPERAAVDFRAVLFLVVILVALPGLYQAALLAFDSVKEQVCRLVDMRRLAVIEALRYEVPATLQEERQLFADLQKFLDTGSGPLIGRARKKSSDGAPGDGRARSANRRRWPRSLRSNSR